MRKHLVRAACLGVLFLAAVPARGAGAPGPARSPGAGTGVVAYYFHVNVRCQTCLLIEQRADEVVREAFGRELQEGVLAWNVVNTQEPGNRRFTVELGLPTRGLVLVAYQKGNPARWKNLDGVWQHVHGDPAAFRQYLTGEIRGFLHPKP